MPCSCPVPALSPRPALFADETACFSVSVITFPVACKNESQICSTVYREVKENSIILMHDEYPTTVRAALRVIDKLQKEGCELSSISASSDAIAFNSALVSSLKYVSVHHCVYVF